MMMMMMMMISIIMLIILWLWVNTRCSTRWKSGDHWSYFSRRRLSIRSFDCMFKIRGDFTVSWRTLPDGQGQQTAGRRLLVVSLHLPKIVGFEAAAAAGPAAVVILITIIILILIIIIITIIMIITLITIMITIIMACVIVLCCIIVCYDMW